MNDAPEMHARPKIVGARIKRTEDPRLLTGLGAYTDDRQVMRVLHVAFRRSDQAHARIRSIDCAAARAAPGVVAVLTAEDLSAAVRPLVATSRMPNYYPTPLLPLAQHKVRYVGEPVVGVIAQSRYHAEDALELIAIDYEPLAAVSDPEAAARSGAALLHEEAGSNVLVSREFKRGDVDAAAQSAPVRVKGRFRMHRKTALAIEPRACLAEYEAGREALTLHSATQVPGIVRDALATALDIPGHRIRVVAPDVGGGFGGKGSLYPEEIFVCAAARQLRRAVKWTSDRLEDLAASNQAFDEIVDAELALDADGRILALSADVIGDVGAYSVYPWTAGLEPVQVVSFLPGPYRIQHYRARTRAVATSKAPTGPVPRCRPPDLNLRHGTADGHGGGADRHGRKGHPAEKPRRGGGASLQGRVRHRLGQIGLSGMPQCRLRRDRLRLLARRAERGARRRPLGRHRHRLLCGIDRHRLAHFRRAGHADQHRDGNRDRPYRFDRRGHGRIRRRRARSGVGDDARPDRRRTPWRPLR